MGSCAVEGRLGDARMASQFGLLAAALESIEGRAEGLAARLADAEARSTSSDDRLAEATAALEQVSCQLESSSHDLQAQRREVGRLAALLEATKLQAALSIEQLQAELDDERTACKRLRAVRDDALLQRDDALVELTNAYADIDAMQATLADSALYVRQLRQRVTELELWQHRHQRQQRASKGQQHVPPDRQHDKDQGVFSMASIRASIQAAVMAAAAEPEAERKRRIRQLQLRWHPDKNPVLREFATEVTKVINEAVAALEQQPPPPQQQQ